ncbi:hypothetical protein EF847_18060 [Actinobacteria bacterium YIM 96077]|uniref:Uncharacterized protein n=1 Tax=Phytoactinopolyspora halophila TaxID=1981511 RepID=A0A329QS47_9ACTN|nr:DUF6113 family protein [Phytoactinopolyspora halophila]AYY14318.1 hypothetical protein EF847_18060 [Actinobacteria bacterium YIM 96077]RAW14861.1 hypothetical protein DPM12_10275 [Phytoactinopolyspora halophila]
MASEHGDDEVGGHAHRNARCLGRRVLHLLALTFFVLVAVAVAVSGVFFHRWASPAGLVLAIVAVVALCFLVRQVAHSRWGIAVAGAAWMAPVLVLAQPRSTGDVLIAGDPTGMSFLLGGVVAWAVTLGLGARRER